MIMVQTRSKTRRINQFITIWKENDLDWYNFKPYLTYIGWRPNTPEEYHRIKKQIDNLRYKPHERFQLINKPDIFNEKL